MKRKIFTILLCLLTLVSALAETNYKVSYTSRLNVRKSPSAKGSLLGSLKKGEEITVISINNGWAKIEYGKSIGYVSAKYLQELPKQTIEEPQKVEEEEVLPEEIIPENYNSNLEVVSFNNDSDLSTPLTIDASIPPNVNLYLTGQLGCGWSTFLRNDGSVSGTMSLSIDILAQLYFEDKVSFIPKNWYSEIGLGYDKKGASSFGMNYIHLGLKPFGYRMQFAPINVILNAGINVAFPLNKLKTDSNSWNSDFQCGVIGGIKAEWKQFSIGCNIEYDFTEVSSSCNQALNNLAILGIISYKFGKFGHK